MKPLATFNGWDVYANDAPSHKCLHCGGPAAKLQKGSKTRHSAFCVDALQGSKDCVQAVRAAVRQRPSS